MELNFSQWLESVALKGSYKGGIFQRLVAAKYQLAPVLDRAALPAFEDLNAKMLRQRRFLNSKFDIQPTPEHPYSSTKALTSDIESQRSSGVRRPIVKVNDEDAGHPTFSRSDNTNQRVVHDLMAHYYGQHPFSARGEYAAHNRHLKTLCNAEQLKAGKCLAAKAMFSETVAQTSFYYIYGGYAPQKVVVLDDFDFANVGLLAPTSRLNRYFYVENKVLVKRPDFQWDRFAMEFPALATELLNQEKTNPNLEPISA